MTFKDTERDISCREKRRAENKDTKVRGKALDSSHMKRSSGGDSKEEWEEAAKFRKKTWVE
jgi:hypothetical protein